MSPLWSEVKYKALGVREGRKSEIVSRSESEGQKKGEENLLPCE